MSEARRAEMWYCVTCGKFISERELPKHENHHLVRKERVRRGR